MPAELTGDLHAILTGAAFAPVTDRAVLRITGPDATRWLNGMVTNSIQALEPGEGNYNFLLNAQGRIMGDCTVYRDGRSEELEYLLETDSFQIDAIQQLFEKFIIMDDVELTRVPEERTLLLLGGIAPQLLGELESGDYLGAEAPVLGPLRLGYSSNNSSDRITTPAPGLVPRFHITAPNALWSASFPQIMQEQGATEISPETLEALRILEARPRYGIDIRNSDTARDLPQETNQPHALHFTKGCYLGQEIVERIHSRGQVHRQFTPFRLEGTPPIAFPTPLEANGKPAGELTGAAPVTTTEGTVWLALGYARREFLELHATLTYAGGVAHPRQPGHLN